MNPVEAFRTFNPSGPVANAFARDRTSTVKALLGPVGGGKSVTCVYDSIRRPSIMPACRDGVVRYRRAIIGTTYGQIERNLYPTWQRWLPREGANWFDGEWEGGGGRFAVHRLTWDVMRKGRRVEVRAEYIFAAIGDNAVEQFMRGFEPTDFWFYEIDQLPEAAIDVAITRLLRYPGTSDDDNAPGETISKNIDFQPQIVGDLNAPDTDSWFYRKFEENPAAGFKVYKQPSGRNAQAENIGNLPAGYYDRQIEILSKQRGGKGLVKRMVDAQYGPSQAGDPVYQEFDDSVHMAAAPLRPMPGVALTLGFDQGLGMPAMVAGQKLANGQLRILAECVPGRMSARRFALACREIIAGVAPGVQLAEFHYCDPAGFTGADKEDGELAWAETVAAELDIVVMPTETNETGLRLQAVVDDLTYMIEPNVPAILVSPACRMLRKGFVSHYMYEKRPDEKSQNLKPVKNAWSNPHDALQYLELGLKGRYGAIEGNRNPSAPTRAVGRNKKRASDVSCTVLSAPVEL